MDKKHHEQAQKTVEESQETTAVEQPQDTSAAEIADLTNTLKRLQAEFENFKKRTEKDNVSFLKNANASLIKDILPVLDSFELAIKNNHESPEVNQYKKGLELIYGQLLSILEDKGLRPIITKDQKFDPFKHEVVMVKESEKADDIILQEFQKGYMLNDIVIRHSKIMIAKHTEQKQG